MKLRFLSITTIVLLLFSSAFLSSCKENEGKKLNLPDSIANGESQVIHNETMKQLVSNTSTPIELASMLKENEIPFSSSYIAKINNTDQIVSANKSAINLGILGADLGYLNLYDKTSSVMSHLTDIKTLADNINIGHFFDFNKISRLAKESNNLDSLIFISVSSFNNMDDYLRENDQTSLSSLMITGIWLESTYLITQVYDKYPSDKLAEKIGEQKILLNDLVIVLNNYKNNEEFAELSRDFLELQRVYNKVEITETYENSEPVIEDGMMKIVQNSKSIVNINNRQIKEINQQISSIRDKIVSGV